LLLIYRKTTKRAAIIKRMKRDSMLNQLAAVIQQVPCPHPLRMAIDGVDASGKTTLADELAEALQGSDREIIRASVDSFHHPKHVRRRQGSLSPQGFYQDSYNYPGLISNLLAPLGPNGSRLYRTSLFDHEQDAPLVSALRTAAEDAILLMDGIFLLRPLLLPYWDLTLYISADFNITQARGLVRDTQLYGSIENAQLRYQQRYIPGQKLYQQEAKPLDKADILIDNNTIEEPKIIRCRLDKPFESSSGRPLNCTARNAQKK